MPISTEEKTGRILEHAIRLHATDIHIIPKTNYAQISFRIQNALIPQETVPLDEADRIIAYLKFQASMDIGERRRPQNGAISVIIDGRTIGLRLSTLPLAQSESLVIRLLPQFDGIPFHKLSLFPKTAKLLLSIMKFSHGLVILTGPTANVIKEQLIQLIKIYVSNNNFWHSFFIFIWSCGWLFDYIKINSLDKFLDKSSSFLFG